MSTLSKATRSRTITLASSSAGPFSLGFRIFDEDAIRVYVDGVENTDWTLTTSFSNGYDDNALITFDEAQDAASVIVILSDLHPDRENELLNGAGMVRTLNSELGRLTSAVADNWRDKLRSLRFFQDIPPIEMDAGKLLIVNDDATAIEMGPDASDIASAQANAAAAAASAETAAALVAGSRPVFTNVAAMVASAEIEVGNIVRTTGYWTAGDGGGADYKIVAAATGTADGGSFIDLSGISGQAQLLDKAPVSPKVFGVKADGTDDHAALQAWVNFTDDCYGTLGGFTNGTARNVYDFGGYIYGLSETLTIPGNGSRTIIICNGAVRAVSGGTGFDNGTYDAYSGNLAEGYTGWLDFLIDLNSAYATVENFNVYCQDIANGIVTNDGRVKLDNVLIRRQKDVGYWQQDGGGDLRTNQVLIQQFNGTSEDMSDESVFTAIGILIETSDCKLTNSTFSWCLKNVVYTSGGIQQMTDCHLFGGTTPPRTNSTLIEYQGTGALVCVGTYLDNGKVVLYRDRCTFRDCTYLTDSADVDQSAMFYLHCRDADQDGTYPQISITGGHFSEYNGADEFIELVNGPSYSWHADAQGWIDLLNDAVVAGNAQESELEVQRQIYSAVNPNGGDFVHLYRSPTNRCMTLWRNADQTTAAMGIGSADNTLWARFSSGANFIVARILGTPLLQVDETDGVTASALKVTNGRATLNGNLVGGNQVTISDDAVASLTPPRTGGWMLLTASGGGVSPEATQSAMIWFDTGTTLAIEKAPVWSSVGTNVDVSTSNVTGTTGTDTKTTVAVQSGVVKIENRTGSARNYQVTWL